jgi:hypothetical protein
MSRLKLHAARINVQKIRVFIVPLGEWAKLMACKFCRFADTGIIDDSVE